MGVLAPGSAHARPSAQPPIDTSGNFQKKTNKIKNSGEKKLLTPLGFLKFFFENFEGYSADMCAEKFPLVSMTR